MDSFKRFESLADGTYFINEVRNRENSVVHLWDPIQQFRLANGDELNVKGKMEISWSYEETTKKEECGLRITPADSIR